VVKRINGGLSIILLLAILALFSFYGCGTTQLTPTENTWAGMQIEQLSQTQLQQMLADSITIYKTINSYQYDIVTGTTSNVTGGSSPWYMSMDTVMSGATNIEADQTHMYLNMSVLFTGMGAKDESSAIIYDIYAIDNWVYMNMAATGMGSQWLKVAMSDYLRQTLNLNAVDRQIKPLETPTKVEYLRTEIFNGVNCYVLSISPSLENLGDWLNEQDTSSKNLNWRDVVTDANVFNNFSLLCYLTADTNQLAGMALDMAVTISPTTAGVSNATFTSMLMSVKMNMQLYDVNVPYSLTLPAEAKLANEVSEDIFKN